MFESQDAAGNIKASSILCYNESLFGKKKRILGFSSFICLKCQACPNCTWQTSEETLEMVKTQVPVELGVYVLGYLKSAPPLRPEFLHGICDNHDLNIVTFLMIIGY